MVAYKTYSVTHEGSSKSLHVDLNRDNTQAAVASSSVFKIYDICEDRFAEVLNLRGSKGQSLNYSSNNVAWNKGDPNILATAASNGAVVIWNLGRGARTKLEHVYAEHKRSVNKVCFHPNECNYLISGSQDGCMKLFDLRMPESVAVFMSNSTSVRDVEFNAHGNGHLFGAVLENGAIQLWDVRRPDKHEKKWPVHSDHVFALNWHPESRFTVATAGRDKQIKIWDSSKAKLEHMVYTIGPVGTIAWRPRHKYQIASCSGLVGDFSVNVWDVRRPYIPYAMFSEHKNVATGIAWHKDAERVITSGKDNLLCHHIFDDATRPSERSNPSGLDMSVTGCVSHARREMKNTTYFPTSISSSIQSNRPQNTAAVDANFRVPAVLGSTRTSKEDLFLYCSSRLEEFRYQLKGARQNCGDFWHDSAAFVHCAKNFQLTGGSLAAMCEHNARMCEAVQRPQHAETWRLMRIIIEEPASLFACPTAGGYFDDDELANLMIEMNVSISNNINEKEEALAKDARELNTDNSFDGPTIESSSFKVRSRSGTNEAELAGSRRAKVTSGGSHKSMKNAAADEAALSDDDQDMEEANELTLTNIASGQMIFGDSDFASWATLERFVSVDPGHISASSENPPGWELKPEAFEPRINLNKFDEAGFEPFGDHFGVDIVTSNSVTVAPNTEELSVTTVTVEDKTSALLATAEALDRDPWMPEKIVADVMKFYAEQGDVQMAVSVYVTLCLHNTVIGVDGPTLEYWFLSYIELLQRLRLFNVAALVTKLSPLACVKELSQQSTTFLSNCCKCNKALSRPQGCWWCERCRRTPNLCCICHKIIKGIFVWCQGCCHGGHLSCLDKWFTAKKPTTLCPSGCGHHCEYQ